MIISTMAYQGKCLIGSRILKTAVLVVVPAVVAYKLYKRHQRNQRRQAYPKDVVILHQFGDGFRAPNLSPWALKLETWLRMAKIPYQIEAGYEMGPKGKIPWITLNGQDLGDSQFCIEFLAKKFNIDFAKEHSASENGIARAFMKMNEESVCWIYAIDTWVHHPSIKDLGLPWIIGVIFKRVVTKRGKQHGYGLHSADELMSIGRTDLASINEFIGTKKYLLGDKVCDADASLFGVLSELRAHNRGPLNRYLTSECPNIVRYLDTIKQTYWPDWTQRCKDKSAA